MTLAPWSHQPQAIRDSIRRRGWRPTFKDCHANAQRLAMDPELSGVEYREGAVRHGGVVFAHAWVAVDGEVIDLTLDPKSTEYLAWHTVDSKSLPGVMLDRGYFAFIHPARVEAYVQEAIGFKPPSKK